MIKRTTVVIFFLSVFLFILSFAIRIYKVDTIPSGVLVDEASFGYNAYSILKTGKDEYGISFPLLFKAFGDQKLPLYTYITVPFVKYLDLSLLAIRLPSVLAGSLLPIVIFILLMELGFKKKVSLFGGLITAISPWSIILSRFGYESNVGLLLFTMGILFSYISLRKKNILIALLGGMCFGLTLYGYVAYRVITPLVLLSIILIKINKNDIFERAKIVLIVSFIFTILPLIPVLFTTQSTARFSQASLTYSSGLKMEIDENRSYCGEKLPKLLCYAASNKMLFMARTYLYRYIDVFSPGYLFLKGDMNDPTLNVDHFGQFYVWLLPFYILGILSLLHRIYTRRSTSIDVFVVIGLFVSVTPSILVGNPHILRLSALFPFVIIVISSGVSLFETYIKRSFMKKVAYVALYLISSCSVIFFLILFLTVHVQKYEIAYRTFVPKLMKYLGQYGSEKQIYINSITEGVMYYSFVNKVDPSFYQKKVIRRKPDSIGFIHSSDLSNIHITDKDFFIVGCLLKKKAINSLYVSHENLKEISSSAKKIIYSENGVDSLAVIYDINKITYKELRCSEE